MLFEPPHEELSDEEIAAVLRQSIAAAGRLSRQADLFLAGVGAEHLVESSTGGWIAGDPAGAPAATSLGQRYRYFSCHPGDHHSTMSESSGATSRTTFGGRPRRRRGWSSGKGAGDAALTTVCRSRCSAVCVATTASSRSLSARARIVRSVSSSSCTAVSASSICSRSELNSLRHLVSCKTLMTELCLEFVNGVARVRQQSLGFLARSGLLTNGLPGGVQLLKAGAAVTMNDGDGNIAVARKVTPLMYPIGWGRRIRRWGYWWRFLVKTKSTAHLQLGCMQPHIWRSIICHLSIRSRTILR